MQERPLTNTLFGKTGLWLTIFLVTYNNVINLLPARFHNQIYTGLNIAVLLVVWIASQRYLHLKPIEIGFTKKNLGRSLVLGLGLSLAVILPFLLLVWLLPMLGVTVPGLHLEKITRATLVVRAFVRIPVGTALFEEVLFRGILYGYLIRSVSTRRAAVVTGIFFALWHITPGILVAHFDFQIAHILVALGFLIVGLAGMFFANLLFAWIRARTRNIAGSILAHALINSLALVIVYFR